AIFWDDYELDSLTGHWDYIEPALFGYGVGRVIEHFVEFYVSPQDNVVAHFQEWMTGTGLLYLKKHMPRVAHVFTCHATVLGRTISATGQDLYAQLETLDPDLKAQELNVRAKHSLESIAAREADVFTTVSEITADECRFILKKEVDLVTPNGFEPDFVPGSDEFLNKRETARRRLIDVAEAVMGESTRENPVLVGISGRYEFRNKGIDIFIDALGQLQSDPEFKGNILAFILIPASQHGPKTRVVLNLKEPDKIEVPTKRNRRYLTYYLVNSEHDAILNAIHRAGLHNDADDQIRIIFIPSYLDGADGIVNLNYYDTMIGLDYTVFPSYYEPWGYTPLESLAFHIPTVTTDLAGFGKWVEEYFKAQHPGAEVLKRNGEDDETIVDKIAQSIEHFIGLSADSIQKYRENAFEISKIALWEQQIQFYKIAYQQAVNQLPQRHKAIIEQLQVPPTEGNISYDIKVNSPVWSQVIIKSNLPEGMESLQALSKNIWWSWDPGAGRLFQSIDPYWWKKSQKNPVELLQHVNFERLQYLKESESFTNELNDVLSRFNAYLDRRNEQDLSNLVAYFSMEYGLHATLKLYSGGLGVLA